MTTTRSAANGRRRTKKPAIATPAELEAAWAPRWTSRSDTWTPRPWVPVAERAAIGRAARQTAPRSEPRRARVRQRSGSGRDHPRPGGRPTHRICSRCVTVGWRPRRSRSTAARPAVMALDLSTTPRSNITVQASGDAHISNFGLFASPERTLVFDSNDFDETLPGPWEWDVKRLAASVVIAAREQRLHAGRGADCRRSPRCAATASRWPRYSGMGLLDIWYDQTTADDIEASLAAAGKGHRRQGLSGEGRPGAPRSASSPRPAARTG